ncbi:MAG: hypothetical protein ACPGYY_03385 [Bacteroidia bacterium]
MKGLNISFNEVQQFNQWWLKIVLALTGGIIFYAIYDSWGSEEVYSSLGQTVGFWLSMILGLAVVVWVWLWKLETHINNYGVDLSCWPIRKKVSWNNIEHLEVVNYGFVGGWGIRHGTKYGTVYNTSGQIGLAIKLKNNKKFLIGTQKGEELKQIVEKWKNI